MTELAEPIKFAELELDHALRRLSREERSQLSGGNTLGVLKSRIRKFQIQITLNSVAVVIAAGYCVYVWKMSAVEQGTAGLALAILITAGLPVIAGATVHSWCDMARVIRAIRHLGKMETSGSQGV